MEFATRLNPGSTFGEAVALVAGLCGLGPSIGTARPTIVTRPRASPTRPPERTTGLPLAKALDLVADAAERLWMPGGAEALAYLHGRGLTDETIRRARLGYVAGASIPARGGDRSYRAAGIVVPWFDGDRLALVKIRQQGDRKPKYVEAHRDGPKLYPSLGSIRPALPLVVVEGEFDALLLGQELGDLACVVTPGSASARLDASVLRAVRFAPALFVATDADEAGARAAIGWPARARRVRPPAPFKDWTEARQGGIDLRCLWLPRLGGADAMWSELSAWRWGPALHDRETDDAADYAREERAALQDPSTH